MKFYFCALILVLTYLPFNVGFAAINELSKNYKGFRSIGMGGILYTTGNYSEALFGNPARLSEVDIPNWTILEINL